MAASEAYTIELPDQPMDCCFHPQQPLIAIGLINGRLQTYKYQRSTSGTSQAQDSPPAATALQLLSIKAHADSCRAVQFSQDGRMLLSASADKSILAVDIEKGAPKARLSDAHAAAINRLTMVSETVLASGDDDGTIQLWDTRQQASCGSFEAHTDFISDMLAVPAQQALLATSGDGTLSVNDLRTIKVTSQTEEDADDELLSIALVKDGKKVVCGAQSGVLNLYSWGAMADCSDRFPGHPSSVDALVKYDEDTVISGSSDGILRILSILPNKMLGVIGAHNDDPVERLALSADRSMLASASHDKTVRLWDVAYLAEEDDAEEQAEPAETENAANDDEDGNGSDSDDSNAGKRTKKQRQKKGAGKVQKVPKSSTAPGFFADLVQA